MAFAQNEPYWRAGLYASLEVAGFRNLLGVTVWQRERLPGVEPSWLADLRLPEAREPAAGLGAAVSALRADRSVVFCGLLADGAGTGATGLVAGFDATSPTLPESVASLAAVVGGAGTGATVERWQRAVAVVRRGPATGDVV